MSWKATAAIKDIAEGLSRTEKLILMMLADYHNEKTGQCNPKISDIASDALMSARRVQQILTALEKREVLSISGREGGRGTAQYWLTCIGYTPEKYSPLNFAPPPKSVSPQGRNSRTPTPETGFAPGAKSPSSKVHQPKEEPKKEEPQEEPQIEPGLFGADLLANRDELIILFEKTVGLVQPIIHDELLALRDRDHFSMEWIAAAFEKSRGKSLAYARGILRRWEMQGHMDAPKVDAQTKAIEAAPESARAQFLRRYQEREGARKGIPA